MKLTQQEIHFILEIVVTNLNEREFGKEDLNMASNLSKRLIAEYVKKTESRSVKKLGE